MRLTLRRFAMTSVRDSKGRWVKGNPLRLQKGDERTRELAAAGGCARAAKLTPEQRSAIARRGLEALAEKHFQGNKQAALEWMGQNGRWAYDAPMREMGIGVFPPPDPLPTRMP